MTRGLTYGECAPYHLGLDVPHPDSPRRRGLPSQHRERHLRVDCALEQIAKALARRVGIGEYHNARRQSTRIRRHAASRWRRKVPPSRRKLEHARFRPPVGAAGVIIACELVPSAGERRVTLAKPRFRACEPCVRRKLLTLGEKTSCKNLRTSPVRCLERRNRRLFVEDDSDARVSTL